MSYRPSVQAQVIGAGTNYALTTTEARIDFGTTDPEIVLPTAGTYTLHGTVTFLFSSVASSIGDGVYCFFFNSTDVATVAGDISSWTNLSATTVNQLTVTGTAVISVSASKTIQLWARNATGARGVVVSTQTAIKYVRLY